MQIQFDMYPQIRIVLILNTFVSIFLLEVTDLRNTSQSIDSKSKNYPDEISDKKEYYFPLTTIYFYV